MGVRENKMETHTKTTLEKIVSTFGKGFSLPKRETTTSFVKPVYEEEIRVIKGHGAYTSESGGPVESMPDRYFGSRKYCLTSGKYLFSEYLPIEERYRPRQVCSCGRCEFEFTHFVISKSSKPASEKLELVHTKILAKLFWLPISLRLTYLKLPEGIRTYRESRGEVEGKVLFSIGIK